MKIIFLKIWHGDVVERIKDHRPVFAKKAVAEFVYMKGWICVGIFFMNTDPIYDYMINR